MPPACAPAPPSAAAASAWAEMVAPLANMAESALAGGARTAASGPVMEVSGSDPRRVEGDPRPPGAHGSASFGVVGERAGQGGCGVWPTSLTHRNSGLGAPSACLGLAGASQRGGPAVDLIHEFPVHLPGGVEVVRQLTGVGLELADLLTQPRVVRLELG